MRLHKNIDDAIHVRIFIITFTSGPILLYSRYVHVQSYKDWII